MNAALTRHGRPYTKAEIRRALGLVETMHPAEVARRLGRSSGAAIRARLKRERVPANQGLRSTNQIATDSGWAWLTVRKGMERLHSAKSGRFGVRWTTRGRHFWMLRDEEETELLEYLARTRPERITPTGERVRVAGERMKARMATMPSRTEYHEGQRLGMRTLIRLVIGRHAAWECRCDCGRVQLVQVTELRNGRHWCRSCGMKRTIANRRSRAAQPAPSPQGQASAPPP